MTAPTDHAEAPSDANRALRVASDLARFYPLVLTTRGNGLVDWASAGWRDAFPDEPSVLGLRLSATVRCLRHPEPTFQLMRALDERGAVPHASIQLSSPEDQLGVTAFTLDLGEDEPVHFVVARSAPEASEFTSHTLLDSHPDAVVGVDEHGFVAYANRATEALVGIAAHELIGSAAVVLGSNARAVTELAEAFVADDPAQFELSLRRYGGPPVVVEARAAPHRDAEGRRCGTVFCLRETTAERDALTDLMRRNGELEHCINTLAHDLRSPLVALLGFSRLLNQDYGDLLGDTGTHFVGRIEQAGRTMEALIHDLLELSRIGQPGEYPALVDPRAVLSQLSAELKPRLDEKCIRLVLPENPPLVYCDRTRLYQVFSNLIGNAVEHMGECESPIIGVEIRDEEGLHRITVCDDGLGIERKHHERIFEPFHSLFSRRNGRSGTGMGLAIVRKIAETRGGRAWVESSPGKGATFHVTLPQA